MPVTVRPVCTSCYFDYELIAICGHKGTFKLFGEANFWSLKCSSGDKAVKLTREKVTPDASERHKHTSSSCMKQSVNHMHWLVLSDSVSLPVEAQEAGSPLKYPVDSG